MAQDNLLGITNSLFGVTPTYQSDVEFGLKNIAGKSAADIGAAMTYAGGKQATRGLLNIMGAEDPEQAEANKFKTAVQQANSQGIDTTKAEGMKQVVSILLNSGEVAVAQKASLLAQAMDQKAAELGKTQAEAFKATQQGIQASQEKNPEIVRLSQRVIALRQAGDPNNEIPALEDRIKSLSKSEMPTSVYNSVYVPKQDIEAGAVRAIEKVAPLLKNIESGVLKFGAAENFKNKISTAAGKSTEGARALSDFNATLEELRLQAQLLQKGTQTDKDAARIMSSFLSEVDRLDTATVKQRLTEISKSLEAQKRDARSIMNSTEARYGGSFQAGTLGVQKQQPTQPQVEATQPAAPATNVPAVPRKRTANEMRILRQLRAANPTLTNISDDELLAAARKQ